MDITGQKPRGSSSYDASRIAGEEVTSPQVCDRCRIKKIGCDGILPSCGNCVSAKSDCTVSVNLRRRTKPRRYMQPKDDAIRKLKAQVQELRTQLEAVNSNRTRLSDHPLQESPKTTVFATVQQSEKYQNSFPRPGNRQNAHQTHVESPQTSQQSDHVIKHLGRLVYTTSGVDRFAGSTTGVHFIHSAEQKYLQISKTATVFQDSVYRLHVLPQPMSLYCQGQYCSNGMEDMLPFVGLGEARSHYLPKLERFFLRWGSTYPVLSPRQFYNAIYHILDQGYNSTEQMTDGDLSSLHQLHLILAINAWDDPGTANDHLTDNSQYYFKLARQTHIRAVQKGDLSTLQSLLLTSLFFQLSGQHSSLAQTSGATVRLAQSLGLHRHTRRFKFCAGEVEMRNRIWWAVYRLDMISSVAHGLPMLINESDVDTELPLDCDFDDITATTLTLPLPGETTRLSLFLSHVRLTRIISSCLKQLYTTTQRRGGVEKILMLDRELRVWEDTCNTIFNANTSNPRQARSQEDEAFAIPYLQLMCNVCMLLVHLPALTFEPKAPQFSQSLKVCAYSSRNIINIFGKHRSEHRLFHLQPNGPRLIFQSALMCLYESWHSTASAGVEQRGTEQRVNPDIPLSDVISTAIDLLELQICDYSATNTDGREGQNWTSSEMLGSAISTLKTLAAHSVQDSEGSTTGIISTSDIHVGESSQQVQVLPPSNRDFWPPSSLGSLNQLEMLEWDFASAPLDSNLIDFNFSQLP